MTVPTTSGATPKAQERGRKKTKEINLASKDVQKTPNPQKGQATPSKSAVKVPISLLTPSKASEEVQTPASDSKKRKRHRSRKATQSSQDVESAEPNPAPENLASKDVPKTPKSSKGQATPAKSAVEVPIRLLTPSKAAEEVQTPSSDSKKRKRHRSRKATQSSQDVESAEPTPVPKSEMNSASKDVPKTPKPQKGQTTPAKSAAKVPISLLTPSQAAEEVQTPSSDSKKRKRHRSRKATQSNQDAESGESTSAPESVLGGTGTVPAKDKRQRSKSHKAASTTQPSTPVRAVVEAQQLSASPKLKPATPSLVTPKTTEGPVALALSKSQKKKLKMSHEEQIIPASLVPKSPKVTTEAVLASPGLSKSQKKKQRKSAAGLATPASLSNTATTSPKASSANIQGTPKTASSENLAATPVLTKSQKKRLRRKSNSLSDAEDVTAVKVPAPAATVEVKGTPAPSKSKKGHVKERAGQLFGSEDSKLTPEKATPVEKLETTKSASTKVSEKKSKKKPESSNGQEEEEEEATPPEFAIPKNQIHDGVNALLKSLTVPKAGVKPKLFQETVMPLYLQVGAIRVPKGESRFLRFVLPHKPLSKDAEVCLIIKDLKRGLKEDHEDTVEQFKSLLSRAGVSNLVHEVMSLRQLKVEYKPYEAKRKLAKRYDAFLVDERVFFRIPLFLGKAFYGTDKVPIPVQLEEAIGLEKHLEKSLRTGVLPLRNTGATMEMQVGNTAMKPEEISANVSSVIESLNAKFPGKFRNIRSLSIHAKGSLSIPLYVSLLTRDQVRAPFLEPRAEMGTVVGDLSTLPPGEAAVVEADGTVRVIRNPAYKPTILDDDEFFLPEPDVADEPESADEDEERPKKKKKKLSAAEKSEAAVAKSGNKKSGGADKKAAAAVGHFGADSDDEDAKSDAGEVPEESLMKDLDGSDSEVDLEEERYLSKMRQMKHEEPEEKQEEKTEKQEEKKEKKQKGGKIKAVKRKSK